MPKSILFIHGGGEGAHAADSKLADSLRRALGPDYQVVNPPMPDENAPEFSPWKAKIIEELAALNGPVILVGHSLGGSTLLKFLTEDEVKASIAGIFIISAPYWSAPDWEVDEYAVREDFVSYLPAGVPLYLYHGTGDTDVPFEHLAMYAARATQATIREVEGRDHQFNDDLSDVAADILRL